MFQMLISIALQYNLVFGSSALGSARQLSRQTLLKVFYLQPKETIIRSFLLHTFTGVGTTGLSNLPSIRNCQMT